MSIQNKFQDLLKNHIAPQMRRAGLKGSGANYSIPSEICWARIGFQKSRYNTTSEKLEFTINLLVVSKADWSDLRKRFPDYPLKPSGNSHCQKGWSERIGLFFPSGADYWWFLDSQTDLEFIAREVVDVLCNKALPLMRQKIQLLGM